MQQTQLTPFAHGDIALSEVEFIDGIPHVTRRAIGEWLEYADPQNAIDVILKRNPHLQTYSVPVKLTGTDGKKYDGFLYHPIGFLLIVMESGQPKAHAMKAAVAEFVWRFAGPKHLSFREREALLKLRRTLLLDLGKTRDAFVREALLADLRDVSLAAGQPLPHIAQLGKDAEQLSLQGV